MHENICWMQINIYLFYLRLLICSLLSFAVLENQLGWVQCWWPWLWLGEQLLYSRYPFYLTWLKGPWKIKLALNNKWVFHHCCLIYPSEPTEKPNNCKQFQQVTIWWAGLMRGAVSVALAYNQVKFWNGFFSMDQLLAYWKWCMRFLFFPLSCIWFLLDSCCPLMRELFFLKWKRSIVLKTFALIQIEWIDFSFP